ncbi:MAG: fluoride efflux transporter CrcB [Gemmatimonadota bacterium]|nr:fluoride efflux transporter CrcB [Gemmatimonadota bacterium]
MIWYIALGSAIGGMLRYLLGGWIQRAAGHGFPLGTLVINVSGSLALGLLLRWASHPPTLNPDLRAFLTVGLCGGFTTFSTFSAESITLMQDGQWGKAMTYVLLSVTLSLAATAAGFAMARVGD